VHFPLVGGVSVSPRACRGRYLLTTVGRVQDDLDLTPYFAPHANGSRSMYRLTGAVTHLGRTVNSGHYIAFARDTDGRMRLVLRVC